MRGELADLAVKDAKIAVRVSPGARLNSVRREEGGLRVHVTAVPQKGRANEAVRALLAEALGIAPSRLELVRGGGGRAKVFRVL